LRLVFADDDLCRLYTDADYRPRGLGPELINACRKKMPGGRTVIVIEIVDYH
jgi:hypothetical protein